MKLAIFNGSPRGNKSNTTRMIESFIKGFSVNGGEVTSYDYLIKEKDLQQQVDNFKSAETILVAFPLYADSVPGMVKSFIETIGDFNARGKKIIFIVHCGFPEGVHCDGVAKYLSYLSKRWEIECLGTIIQPGSEGLRFNAEAKNKKLLMNFETLGAKLASTGVLDSNLINKMKTPYRLPKLVLWIFPFLGKMGILNKYWDENLKKNKVFERRFDTPYLEK